MYMPANIIKSYAKKTGKSEAELEKYWNESKEAAKDQKGKGKGEDAYYGTVMTIFKAKLKKHAGLSEGCMKFSEYVGLINEAKIADADFNKEFV